jgi:hypothetical protein
MSGHTPGPWQRARNNVHAAQIAVVHHCLNNDWVEVWSPAAFCATEETQEANARLIAAAPELLEALRKYMDNDDLGARLSSPSYLAAKTAIAKATQP